LGTILGAFFEEGGRLWVGAKNGIFRFFAALPGKAWTVLGSL